MENRNRLILASASSGRRWLLNQLCKDFEIIPSFIEEPSVGFSNPKNMVQSIAWMKAVAVARELSDGLIIAADTIVWIDGQPFLKPESQSHARDMIMILQGRIHELWTGVVVWDCSRNIQFCWQERSLVRVAPLCKNQIDKYLNERLWEGCSGAYSFEMNNDPIIQIVDGSKSNVVGLPMESLAGALANMKIEIDCNNAIM